MAFVAGDNIHFIAFNLTSPLNLLYGSIPTLTISLSDKTLKVGDITIGG